MIHVSLPIHTEQDTGADANSFRPCIAPTAGSVDAARRQEVRAASSLTLPPSDQRSIRRRVTPRTDPHAVARPPASRTLAAWTAPNPCEPLQVIDACGRWAQPWMLSLALRLVCPIAYPTAATGPHRLCPRPVTLPGHSATATGHLPHMGTVPTLPQRAFGRCRVVGDVRCRAIHNRLRAPDAIDINGHATETHACAIGTHTSMRMRAGHRHRLRETESRLLHDRCGLFLWATRMACFHLLGNIQI
jgi:hypothetical protein